MPPAMKQAGRAITAALAVLALALSFVLFTSHRTASATVVGAGGYLDSLPGAGPAGCGSIGSNARTFVTANAPAGGVPTNDWWSSLLWKRNDCAGSDNLAAHPLSLKATTSGLGVDYPTTATITGSATTTGEYHFEHSTDFTIGVAGLTATAMVDGWSDWTVTSSWANAGRSLKTTIGHGLPFVHAEATGGNAQLTFQSAPTVWSNSGKTLGVTINGHDYALFAPTGATWTISGASISSTLAGRGYFSIAVLPTTAQSSNTERTNLLNAFAPYAYSFITGTTVSWSFNEATSRLTTTYNFTTQAREGAATGTVAALYPHLWKNLAGGTPIANTYISPRGQMRVLTNITSFQTSMVYRGVLPELPAVGMTGADLTTLNNELNAVGDPFAGFGNDTYWTGKALGRAARLAEIADLVGNTGVRDRMLSAIKSRLTDWFTATPGKTARVFGYNSSWGTLIGYPASYGSDQELNDHHFHYGYYIAAAATLAKYDPAWASPNQYGGMVDMLIRDANNYDRNDRRFPFLRDFDIYAGHDWASGHANFFAGNNQESSSEGMNFDAALIQFGQATGNRTVRDAGIYQYVTQAAAIAEYWHDTTNSNFPSAFPHNTVGMVWGNGGAYATWFSGEPEMIHGINMLPITGGSLYLGYNPGYINTNLQEMRTVKPSAPTVWRDIIWEFQALSQPDAALQAWRSTSYTSEEGESRAHTFHWLRNLAALGQVDTTVTANTPLYAVFTKNGARTYVAANRGTTPLTVTFSTGVSLTVQPGRTATTGAITWQGGSGPGTPGGGGSSTFFVNTNALSTTAGASGSSATIPSAGGANWDGTPHNPVTYTACGFTGTYDSSKTTQFSLGVDAGTGVGAGVQARISYAPTGSTYTRTETYHYFATDPINGWEIYTHNAGQRATSGTPQSFSNGCIRLEVWNAIGNVATSLRVNDGQSRLVIPFNPA
ncbi:glycosyl hydrolase [Kibdelosporangium persicum]|uniref:glucan endo-1,3-beta-D-glucosidase n=1 Tax=Kibdelosporangium persicum TaxID=2698649 RepID=A0ABX2FFV7_9PSEU|nr:glycosyl hydrolase [Kibdelosporangium persicum]NRN70279.1 Glycosyl hydrolase [Kibdelosporangium persicum]